MAKKRKKSAYYDYERVSPNGTVRRHRAKRSARHGGEENPKSETGSLLIAGLVGVAAGAAVFWAFTTTNAFQQYYTNQLASGQISPS